MAQQHMEPGTKVNLTLFGPALQEARTTAIVKGQQLEIVRLVLLKDKRMKEHKVAGEMTVQCLEGCIEFQTPDVTHTLTSGDFIHLEAGVAHSLHAVRDSSALLTIFIGSV